MFANTKGGAGASNAFMRCNKLSELTPAHVNIVGLDRHSQPMPIPASPYAYKPPATGVRSPDYQSRSRERNFRQN